MVVQVVKTDVLAGLDPHFLHAGPSFLRGFGFIDSICAVCAICETYAVKGAPIRASIVISRNHVAVLVNFLGLKLVRK